MTDTVPWSSTYIMKCKHFTVENDLEKIEPGMNNLKFFLFRNKGTGTKLILHFVTCTLLLLKQEIFSQKTLIYF